MQKDRRRLDNVVIVDTVGRRSRVWRSQYQVKRCIRCSCEQNCSLELEEFRPVDGLAVPSNYRSPLHAGRWRSWHAGRKAKRGDERKRGHGTAQGWRGCGKMKRRSWLFSFPPAVWCTCFRRWGCRRQTSTNRLHQICDQVGQVQETGGVWEMRAWLLIELAAT